MSSDPLLIVVEMNDKHINPETDILICQIVSNQSNLLLVLYIHIVVRYILSLILYELDVRMVIIFPMYQ